ncbi:DUF6691 family protein [Phaeovulum sp.]|uniref:DUF6691 family protein n=1 Tax=Phaeovulum sp. TaxID=2934796 RepID=UPI0027303BB2|nr:DUF6691 family protein [Phaeovulum sp.]MDP1668331.1 hypothetical protein [Phaeovulum sp.]MDZ4118179.1 DUF6691 family protein [Phaeovulum sp.]
MLRNLLALVAGGLFGAGLLVSGMVDTAKVQGWLDVFGIWDPTLAFVLGGAVAPMVLVWRLAKRREKSLLGLPMPRDLPLLVDRNLVLGSLLFGAGWGIAGFCPGPALAALGFGGWQVWVFVAAMALGMAASPLLQRRLDLLDAPAEG